VNGFGLGVLADLENVVIVDRTVVIHDGNYPCDGVNDTRGVRSLAASHVPAQLQTLRRDDAMREFNFETGFRNCNSQSCFTRASSPV
jgi:hypothetical protein